jgi:hypothetical protein
MIVGISIYINPQFCSDIEGVPSTSKSRFWACDRAHYMVFTENYFCADQVSHRTGYQVHGGSWKQLFITISSVVLSAKRQSATTTGAIHNVPLFEEEPFSDRHGREPRTSSGVTANSKLV